MLSFSIPTLALSKSGLGYDLSLLGHPVLIMGKDREKIWNVWRPERLPQTDYQMNTYSIAL